MSPLDELLARPKETRRLGVFHLDPSRKLGEGGFAPVFLADEIHDGAYFRKVALKVFVIAAGDEGAAQRKRIVREASALCKVKDRNVVRYYSIARDDELGLVGIAMEHVEGASLAERLREGPIAADETARIGASVARALAAIHERSLVHRDVKPANVIDAKGVHTLIDFGIAASPVREDAATTAPPLADPSLRGALADFVLEGLTAAHADPAARRTRQATLATIGVVGTMGYIDPACLKGGTAERAADLYALGVTLYECLTGKLPARAAADAADGTGTSAQTAFEAVLMGDRAPPPVLEIAPATPVALGRLVDRLVDPDAEKRPESATAVVDAIGRAMSAAPARDLPPAPTRATRESERPTPAPKAPVPPRVASPEEVERELVATRARLARATRRRIAVGVGVAALAAGGAVGAWRFVESRATASQQTIDDHWATFLVCMVGERPDDPYSVAELFRHVETAWKDESRWPMALLERCRPHAIDLMEEVPRSNPQRETFKSKLAYFARGHEAFTAGDEATKSVRDALTAVVEASRDERAGVSFGTPRKNVARPDRTAPLMRREDVEALRTIEWDEDKSGGAVGFALSGETVRGNCVFSQGDVRCVKDGGRIGPISHYSVDRPLCYADEAHTKVLCEHCLAELRPTSTTAAVCIDEDSRKSFRVRRAGEPEPPVRELFSPRLAWDHALAIDLGKGPVKKRRLVDVARPDVALADLDRLDDVAGCKAPNSVWAMIPAYDELIVLEWRGDAPATVRRASGYAMSIGCDDGRVWFTAFDGPTAKDVQVSCASGGTECKTSAPSVPKAPPFAKNTTTCVDGPLSWIAYHREGVVFAGPAATPVPIVDMGVSSPRLELVCGSAVGYLLLRVGTGQIKAINLTTSPASGVR